MTENTMPAELAEFVEPKPAKAAKPEPEPKPAKAEEPKMLNIVPATSHEEFLQTLIEDRNRPEPPPPPPAGPTERQWNQTLAEREAGKRRVQHFKEQAKMRPPPPKMADLGATTPVSRPGTFTYENKVGGK